MKNEDLDIRDLLEEINKYVELGQRLSDHIGQLPMAFYSIAKDMIGEDITHEEALDKVEELDRRLYIHMNDRTKDSKKFF